MVPAQRLASSREDDPILKSMNETLRLAIRDALAQCYPDDPFIHESAVCANLWTDIEELTKAVYDYLERCDDKTPLEELCERDPGAPECKEYDV
jgi:hypothetical protein